MDTVQTELELTRTVPDRVQPSGGRFEAIAGDVLIFLVPVGFVAIWAISSMLFTTISKASHKNSPTFKRPPKVPCRECRFFSTNPYLRCAVHPTEVMTDKAIDCSDYCEK